MVRELPSADPAPVADELQADRQTLQRLSELVRAGVEGAILTLRPSQREVYHYIISRGPVTDAALAEIMDKSIRQVVPRRSELTGMGLVAASGRQPTPSGRSATMWDFVPPDMIEQERGAAHKRGPRKKSVFQLPVDQRMALVRAVLADREVRERLLAEEPTRGHAGTARRLADRYDREEQRRRKEHAQRLREAERLGSPELNFLKAVSQLRRGIDAVKEVARVLQDDVEAVQFDGQPLIDPAHWPSVLVEVDALVDISTRLRKVLGIALGEEDDDVLDVEAIDVEGWELEGGAGGG